MFRTMPKTATGLGLALGLVGGAVLLRTPGAAGQGAPPAVKVSVADKVNADLKAQVESRVAVMRSAEQRLAGVALASPPAPANPGAAAFAGYVMHVQGQAIKAWDAGTGQAQPAGPPAPAAGTPAPADSRPVVYRAGKLPPGMPPWFQELDIDHDGQVGLYEWRRSGRPIAEFLAMDRNKDGFLTIDEVMRYQAARAKGQPRPVVAMANPTPLSFPPRARVNFRRPPGGIPPAGFGAPVRFPPPGPAGAAIPLPFRGGRPGGAPAPGTMPIRFPGAGPGGAPAAGPPPPRPPR